MTLHAEMRAMDPMLAAAVCELLTRDDDERRDVQARWVAAVHDASERQDARPCVVLQFARREVASC